MEDKYWKVFSVRLPHDLVEFMKSKEFKSKFKMTKGEFVEKAIRDLLSNESFKDELRELIPKLINNTITRSDTGKLKELVNEIEIAVRRIKADTLDITSMAELKYERVKFMVIYLVALGESLPGDPLTLEVLAQLSEAGFLRREGDGKYVLSNQAFLQNKGS